MPIMTLVIESYPELRLGFLEHPEGRNKICFDHTGWRKKSNDGSLQNADTKTKKFPPEGSKVEILELADATEESPKAVIWRLVERGKQPAEQKRPALP